MSPEDKKWFREKVEKKNPSVCYVDPAPSVSLVFVIIVPPDTYHGTRVVTNTSTNSNPTSGTITDQDGSTVTYSGTQETTSTSSTAVPYSFEHGLYTLSVERQQKDGSYACAPEKVVKLGDFVESVYFPRIEQHMRPSTLKGYRDIWALHLKPRCANVWMKDVRTYHVQSWMDDIAWRGSLGKRTL